MFSNAELTLIKNTFADNDELLYAIRNVMLQFPISDEEKQALKAQITPEVYALLKKKLLPEVDPSAPFGQLADLSQTLTNDLKTKAPEEMDALFAAKKLELMYLRQQMAVLRDFDAPQPFKLADWAELLDNAPFTNYVNTTARNFILGFVDPMLRDFKVLAGTKTESLEKQKERLTRDSSK